MTNRTSGNKCNASLIFSGSVRCLSRGLQRRYPYRKATFFGASHWIHDVEPANMTNTKSWNMQRFVNFLRSARWIFISARRFFNFQFAGAFGCAPVSRKFVLVSDCFGLRSFSMTDVLFVMCFCRTATLFAAIWIRSCGLWTVSLPSSNMACRDGIRTVKQYYSRESFETWGRRRQNDESKSWNIIAFCEFC